MFTDAVDSFYQYTKGRLAMINPNRKVKGLLAAQDWPPKALSVIDMETFYVVVLAETPLGRQAYSAASPMVFHHVRWVWIIKGTELQQGVRGGNRGDRYRTMQTMKGELINALSPNFTEKKTWALDGNGVFQGTSQNPVATITWTPPDITERLDKSSGLMYGSAAVKIWDITDAVTP